MAPQVSIVMRSHNDIEYIEKTLEMVFKQNFTDFELINVDCSSTDGTFDVIKRFNPDKSYQIPPQDYVPGKVLNEAVKKCRGAVIVFNNSDCLPCDKKWLENLIKPILDVKAVAAYGTQLPRPDATPLVKKDNYRAFSSISQSWFHFFSLATSAILKAELEAYPFNEKIQYSEDVDWSYRARIRGSVIVFAKDACVEHSHNYSPEQLKKRFYGEGYAEGAIYGHRGRGDNFVFKVLKSMTAEILRDAVYLLKNGQIGWIPRSPAYRWRQRYWTYKGLKDYFKSANSGGR